MQSSGWGNEYKVVAGHNTSNQRVQSKQTGERVIQKGREMLHDYMSPGTAAGSRNKPLERVQSVVESIPQLRRQCEVGGMEVWRKFGKNLFSKICAK